MGGGASAHFCRKGIGDFDCGPEVFLIVSVLVQTEVGESDLAGVVTVFRVRESALPR